MVKDSFLILLYILEKLKYGELTMKILNLCVFSKFLKVSHVTHADMHASAP